MHVEYHVVIDYHSQTTGISSGCQIDYRFEYRNKGRIATSYYDCWYGIKFTSLDSGTSDQYQDVIISDRVKLT